MALDSLDYAVLCALALAVAAYFTKGTFWGVADNGTKVVSDSRDIAEVVKDNNKQYLVFYGSQTGTAEDYAHKFAKELKSKFKLNVMVADLADYDFETLNALNCVVSFFISTYGEGDFPDQAVPFEDHISSLTEGELGSLKYTLFGLGNSTYEFYNGAAVKAQKALQTASATVIGEFGMGDDGAGTLDEDYLAWKEATLDILKSSLNLTESDAAFETSLKLNRLHSGEFDEDAVFLGEPDKSYLDKTVDLSLGPFDHAHPYLAQIAHTKELFKSEDRSCIHAEFDLSNTNLRYSTGDHLAVWPSNSNEKLEKFFKIVSLWEDRESVIDVKALDSTVNIPFPSPTTIETVFRHFKEISGPVSRQMVANLKQFAPNDKAKAECDRLSKDKVIYAEEIHAKKFDFSDVLALLSGGEPWKLPLEFLIESVSPLQPRYYSISSSSLSEKTNIHITAVVEAENFEDRVITGVTTNLLRNIEIQQNKESSEPHLTYKLEGPRDKFKPFKLPVHVRRSTFRLPTSPTAPVIMIGPGTGVAPFRGFVRDRVAQAQQGKSFAKMVLLYGCRRSDEDFLYKEEWVEYAKTLGENFEMHSSFSREGKDKAYVQHKLYELKDEIMELIDSGAFIYVCGDAARMARDVNDTLCKIISEKKGFTLEKAHEILKNFRTLNKYQEDVW
jgi:NADPH-ferrihemoprotein reductase